MRLAGSRHHLRSATRERFSGFHPTIAMRVPTGGAGRTVQFDPLQSGAARPVPRLPCRIAGARLLRRPRRRRAATYSAVLDAPTRPSSSSAGSCTRGRTGTARHPRWSRIFLAIAGSVIALSTRKRPPQPPQASTGERRKRLKSIMVQPVRRSSGAFDKSFNIVAGHVERPTDASSAASTTTRSDGRSVRCTPASSHRGAR